MLFMFPSVDDERGGRAEREKASRVFPGQRDNIELTNY